MRDYLRTTATAALLSAAVGLGFAAPALAEIKLGSVLSASGPASFLGDPESKTLRMLVEETNKAGGIDGEPITLIEYDDGGDANKARTFATRLVEDDEVIAVIGGSTTGATMAMVPVFEDAEIPFISLAGAVVIIDPVKKWVFKTPHTDRMACQKIFEDMQKEGIARVGMISGTGGFGKSMREQCLEVAGDYGIAVEADETYGPKDADMTPQLTKIKNTDGVQAVLNPGFGQGPAVVTRNYRQLGLTQPLYQSHGVASQSFIDLSGDAAEGVRMAAPSLLVADALAADDPQRQVVTGYKKAYEDETGEPVSTFGGYAFDAFQMLKAAIEKAGSDDPAAIRDALEQTAGYVGVTGVFTFAPDDHLGLDPSAFRMVEVKDGKFVLIGD